MTSLKKSLSVLNSSLFLVLTSYFLNVIFSRLVYLRLEILAILLILPLSIFVHGGIYGMLAELASGEEIVVSFNRFKTNAVRYWRYYFFVTGFPLLIYFVLAIKSPGFMKMDAFSFLAHINPLLLFILSFSIMRDKYIRPFDLGKRTIPFPFPTLFILFLLFLSALFIFHLPYAVNVAHFELSRITKFGHAYITLLVYAYFSFIILEPYPEIRQKYHKDKEIYLINPLGGGLIFHLSSFLIRSYPPFFVVIKALTPKGYHFREFNRVFWHNRYYAPGKLVAITCFSSNSIDAYRIAKEFKESGSKVVLGGPHVTYFPDEALEYCDSVVCGEMENVWPQVIQDYENSNLQKTYTGQPAENCHELIYQELLNSPPEITKDFLETSRGCKFHCYFCAVPSLSQGNLRNAKVHEIVELVKKVRKKYKHIVFLDNNIYSDPAFTKELLQALKATRVHWSSQCSIDIAKNEKILQLAKESGCKLLLIGFEISEDCFEKAQGGKLALADHYKEYAKKVKKMGIRIKAHYIFGFESHDFKYLFKLWKFCFAINPFITALSILTPYPGSQFYYDTIRKDRISNLDWRHYGGQTLVFRHPRMNNVLLARLYPVVFLFFLFTTSKLGYALLLLCLMNVAGII